MMVAIGSGLLVGLSLGLTGGGGSILAVPLLLYGLGLELRAAVKASLAVVGLTSLFGTVLQRHLVFWRAGLVLGAGGIFGAPAGAWLGRVIPETVILLAFAGLMVIIAFRFWQGSAATEVPVTRFSCRREEGETVPQFKAACAGKLVMAGAAAGVLAGLFGVGGGFLLVPALMIVAGLPLMPALATSLLSIAVLSAASFLANQAGTEPLEWVRLLPFFGSAFAGMFLGSWLKPFIPAAALKKTFAVMVVLVAIGVAFQTLR